MNIIELINSSYQNLSPGQKAIGDYISANPERACFLSLKEFSAATETTPVSVLRFARKLGLENFIALKKELQTYVSSRLSPNDKLSTAMGQMADRLQDAIQEVAQMDLVNIRRTVDSLNAEDILRAVDILKGSQTIYLAGVNISRSVNICFHSRLNAVSINTQHFEVINHAMLITRLTFVKPGDAFIIVSFPPYTEEVVYLAQHLHSRGIPVILISDTKASPLAECADVVFTCAVGTPIFFNSYSSPMVVANVLTSVLALQMEERFLNMRATKKELTAQLESFLSNTQLYKDIP